MNVVTRGLGATHDNVVTSGLGARVILEIIDAFFGAGDEDRRIEDDRLIYAIIKAFIERA